MCGQSLFFFSGWQVLGGYARGQRPGRIITSRPARATTGAADDMQQAQRVECSSCHAYQWLTFKTKTSAAARRRLFQIPAARGRTMAAAAAPAPGCAAAPRDPDRAAQPAAGGGMSNGAARCRAAEVHKISVLFRADRRAPGAARPTQGPVRGPTQPPDRPSHARPVNKTQILLCRVVARRGRR